MTSLNDLTVRKSSDDRTLVIMAKAPKPGTVKTRLAQQLPPDVVSSLYRCFLEDTIALARSLVNVEVAIMCPAPDVNELASLAGESVRVVAQKGEGLAGGLTSVFAHFAAPVHQRVVAFDSDSPHLPASVLENAFAALATCDVVVGPTHDGGYYLVGATASHPGLFNGDSMGKSNALEELLARTEHLGLSVTTLERFYDVDVAGDLLRLDAELQVSPSRAPRTAGWLAESREVIAQLRPGTATP
jgi:rSAM/selenodomain-associated transferase 1